MSTGLEILTGNEPSHTKNHFECLLYGRICNISICENQDFCEHFFGRKYAFCGEIVMFASTNVKMWDDILVLRGHRYRVSYPKISFFTHYSVVHSFTNGTPPSSREVMTGR